MTEAVLLTTENAVLSANLSFYEAFGNQDYEAMVRVWSTSEQIACIHPGWQALRGRDGVLASWRAILDGDRTATVRCADARAILLDQTAIVTCVEQIDRAKLVATNVFVLDGGLWKMVHHQAAPFTPRTLPSSDKPPIDRLN
jgi:limonene-1,2-epoxide hydrolase